MTTPRRSALPPTLQPRGLRREEAAAYVGVSAMTFDAMVRARTMPPPKIMPPSTVHTWDRLALDRAYAALPDTAGEREADPWGDVAA